MSELIQSHARVATFSRGIARHQHLRALLGCREVIFKPASAEGIDAVVGWGLKDNTLGAIAWAHKHGLPFLRLEDGFLRSVGLGVEGDTALSMVVDDLGMYYDARRPSRLERILEEDTKALRDGEVLERARRCMDFITEHGLSKYNSFPPEDDVQGAGAGPIVLVIDQTAGDRSVQCGQANAQTFAAMLTAAIDDNPDAQIWVKTHPDVLSGAKKGYLGTIADHPRVQLRARSESPIALLRSVDRVYTVTSQMGFEALMLGKQVECFGMPFYAGWGLTSDRQICARRTRKRSIEELFAAAYLLYPRYVRPERDFAGEEASSRGEIEDVIRHLALQREMFAKNRGDIFCFGFRPWKHGYVRDYLRCPGNRVVFPWNAVHAKHLGIDRQSRIVVWGQRASTKVQALAAELGISIERMEDGFLRSVGLGSDFEAPASLVVDSRGIYYNPLSESDLEDLLAHREFDEALIERARRFRMALQESGLSKYNLGSQEEIALETTEEQKVILVPGQVEDDASIQLGCRSIKTNTELLQAVREARPDDYIVFKPHPDVLSGNRKGEVVDPIARGLCDQVEKGSSLAQCLAVCDEVHVLTSLVGFEALLREIPVSTYGQPFYNGWGLTEDRHPVTRRGRTLRIDELCAAVYFLYPRYLDRNTRRFVRAEHIAGEIRAARQSPQGAIEMPWLQRQLLRGRNILAGLADR